MKTKRTIGFLCLASLLIASASSNGYAANGRKKLNSDRSKSIVTRILTGSLRLPYNIRIGICPAASPKDRDGETVIGFVAGSENRRAKVFGLIAAFATGKDALAVGGCLAGVEHDGTAVSPLYAMGEWGSKSYAGFLAGANKPGGKAHAILFANGHERATALLGAISDQTVGNSTAILYTKGRTQRSLFHGISWLAKSLH